jgi:hypothetical protein
VTSLLTPHLGERLDFFTMRDLVSHACLETRVQSAMYSHADQASDFGAAKFGLPLT